MAYCGQGATKGQRTVKTIRVECIIAYLSHGVWNVQRSSEVGAFVEHICWNPLHAVADGECPRAAFKRLGIVGNIYAIDGVEVHMRKDSTLGQMGGYSLNITANGNRAGVVFKRYVTFIKICATGGVVVHLRKATTTKRPLAYRGHTSTNSQRTPPRNYNIPQKQPCLS